MLAGTHLNHAACRTRTSTQAGPPEADRPVLDCQMWDEQEQEYEQEYEQEQEQEYEQEYEQEMERAVVGCVRRNTREPCGLSYSHFDSGRTAGGGPDGTRLSDVGRAGVRVRVRAGV